jgi:hypothetical protein
LSNFSLPESGAKFGKNNLESRSFDAFKFLQANEFSLVYFTSSSGIGYYSIHSHHQGLLGKNTKFVLGIDTLPLYTQMKNANEIDDYVVADTVALKEKYMIEKSAALSVIIFFFMKYRMRLFFLERMQLILLRLVDFRLMNK